MYNFLILKLQPTSETDDVRLLSGIELTLEIQKNMNPKATLKEFKEELAQNEKYQLKIKEIRKEVEDFAGKFPMPGLPEL